VGKMMSVRTKVPGEAGETEQQKEATDASERGRVDGVALPVPAQVAALAFARVWPEIDAMSAVGLRRITVAVPAAVTIGLGAMPNIEAKMAEIRRILPLFDYERAGRLREYAYAALYAHHRVALSAEGEARLRALVEEAVPLRERLLRTAELHAYYGELDPGVVASIRRGTGHLDTANDLAQIALLFRGARDVLAGRTPVTEADLTRAAELSDAIIDALGRRRVGTDGASTPSQAEEDRIKAFWLFYAVYEESRLAMAYLRRHEGDADQLVPSLFLGHRRRSSSTREEPGGGEVSGGPADPSESD
jgi:hypothetical protein